MVWHAQYRGFDYEAVEELELCLGQQDGYVAHDVSSGGMQLTRHHEYTISFSDGALLKRAVARCAQKMEPGVVIQIAGDQVRLTNP